MFTDDPITLLHALAIVAVVLAVGWIIASLALQLAPRATSQFALANLLFVVGTLLETHRGQEGGYLTFQGADLLELIAMTLMRSGMQRIERLRFTGREHLVVVVLAGIGMIAFPPRGQWLGGIVVVYGLAAGWISLRLYAEATRSIRALLGRWAAIGILWPSALFGLIMLLRGLWFATHPSDARLSSDISAQAKENVLLLWMVCVILLTANMSLIGLVVGRLTATARDLASRDALTGVFNRRVLVEQLAAEHERFRRGGPGFAVAMIDLDHFKAINDTYGHAAGDAALRQAAHTIGGLLRSVDTLARYGGEEFIVIFAMSDLPGTADACERIRAALAATPIHWAGKSVALTASFGVAACANPEESRDSLLRRADTAVYRAKSNGRNRIEVAPPCEPSTSAAHAEIGATKGPSS